MDSKSKQKPDEAQVEEKVKEVVDKMSGNIQQQFKDHNQNQRWENVQQNIKAVNLETKRQAAKKRQYLAHLLDSSTKNYQAVKQISEELDISINDAFNIKNCLCSPLKDHMRLNQKFASNVIRFEKQQQMVGLRTYLYDAVFSWHYGRRVNYNTFSIQTLQKIDKLIGWKTPQQNSRQVSSQNVKILSDPRIIIKIMSYQDGFVASRNRLKQLSKGWYINCYSEEWMNVINQEHYEISLEKQMTLFQTHVEYENFAGIAEELIRTSQYNLQLMEIMIEGLCKQNQEFILPLSLNLIQNTNPTGRDIVTSTMPNKISSVAHIIAHGGHLKIRANKTDCCLFLQDSRASPQQKQFSITKKRFMNTAKICDSYYVFAGPGEKGEDQLWQISQVDNTKYFVIKCKGKDGGRAALYVSQAGNQQEKPGYLFAKDASMLIQNHHFSFFVDTNDNLQFKSRTMGLVPYIMPPSQNSDTKWDKDMYVLLSNSLTEQKMDWTLLNENENIDALIAEEERIARETDENGFQKGILIIEQEAQTRSNMEQIKKMMAERKKAKANRAK